jgi:hypothetical protein
MRSASERADDRDVDAGRELRLVLAARFDREGSISGSIELAEGGQRRFTGWLGLAAAITELAERDMPAKTSDRAYPAEPEGQQKA